MKKMTKFLFAALALTAATYSCGDDNGGNTPPVVEDLVLTVDKTTIKGDGKDAATFKVMQGEVDVTAAVQVCSKSMAPGCLLSNVFTWETPGEYEFYAYFTADLDKPDHLESNVVTVTVEEAAPEFDGSKAPQRNVSFFVITSSGCGPCYQMKYYVTHDLETQYGERLVLTNLYSFNISGSGVVATRDTDTFEKELQSKGFPVNFYPNPIIELTKDWRNATANDQYWSDVKTSTIELVEQYLATPAKAGIKVESTVVDSKVNAKVTVGAKEAGTYAVAVLLVEDHISCPQAGYSGNYDHTNVFRKSATTSIFGEEIGAIEAGSILSKEYSFDVAANYNVQNLSLIVYTLYKDGDNWVVTNSVKASANGLTDFKYVE
jgi:hypothetical protein